jgi:hypothetical protein
MTEIKAPYVVEENPELDRLLQGAARIFSGLTERDVLADQVRVARAAFERFNKDVMADLQPVLHPFASFLFDPDRLQLPSRSGEPVAITLPNLPEVLVYYHCPVYDWEKDYVQVEGARFANLTIALGFAQSLSKEDARKADAEK